MRRPSQSAPRIQVQDGLGCPRTCQESFFSSRSHAFLRMRKKTETGRQATYVATDRSLVEARFAVRIYIGSVLRDSPARAGGLSNCFGRVRDARSGGQAPGQNPDLSRGRLQGYLQGPNRHQSRASRPVAEGAACTASERLLRAPSKVETWIALLSWIRRQVGYTPHRQRTLQIVVKVPDSCNSRSDGSTVTYEAKP